MKKTKALLIAALFVCFVVVFVAAGCTNSKTPTEKESEGLSFDSNGEGTCFVAGLGECADTRIVIPSSSPDGDRVTGIGSGAFAGRTELEKVVLPSGVTFIAHPQPLSGERGGPSPL